MRDSKLVITIAEPKDVRGERSKYMLGELENINLSDSGFRIETGSKRSKYAAPKSYWSDVKESQHFVQFYKSDAYLVTSVAEYVLEGLKKGDTCIIAATQKHIDLIEILLAPCTDLDTARLSHRYIVLEVDEILPKFMRGNMPDAGIFEGMITPLLERALANKSKVRIFGEIVSVLNDRKNPEASVRLEEIWNDIRRKYEFSLFCAYPTESFATGVGGKQRTHICDEHTRVIPDESYTALKSTDERLRTIALLQQRNAQLEAELADLEKTISARKLNFLRAGFLDKTSI